MSELAVDRAKVTAPPAPSDPKPVEKAEEPKDKDQEPEREPVVLELLRDRFERTDKPPEWEQAPLIAAPKRAPMRAYTVDDSGAIVIGRRNDPPAVPVSTLTDETIGDQTASCLELAYESGEDVKLFQDRDGVGHAIAASQADTWLKDQEPGKYTELATIKHAELEKIFATEAGSTARKSAVDALGKKLGVKELGSMRWADAAEGGSLDYGRLELIAPAEYAAFLANPDKTTFDKLVAKVAAHTYVDLRETLASRRTLLAVAGNLEDFARTIGLEAYATRDFLKNSENLEYALRELNGGLWSTVGTEYLRVLGEQNRGQDMRRLDITKMSPEQILSLSAADRKIVTNALRGIGDDTAGNSLADILDYFARAGVDGNTYGTAKTAAQTRLATMLQKNPELVALLKEDSTFVREALPHYDEYQLIYNRAAGNFAVDMDPTAAANYQARLANAVAANGPAKYLSSLAQSVVELDNALTKIGEVPSFENLGVIAGQIVRSLEIDAGFTANTPEGKAVAAARDEAKRLMDGAAQQRKLKDMAITALGGLEAGLAVVAGVGAVFTGGAAWVGYLAVAAGISGISRTVLEVTDLVDRSYNAALNIPGYFDVNGKTMPTAGDWAGAIIDGVASAADIGVLSRLPRLYGAAVKSEMLARTTSDLAKLGVDGLTASKLGDRLKYFDDLTEVKNIRRTLLATDAETASTIVASMSSMSDAQILQLNRVLSTDRALQDFATTMRGLDRSSSTRALKQTLAIGSDTEARDVLGLAARMKMIKPSGAAALLSSDAGLDNFRNLLAIGSPKLADAAILRADAAKVIPELLAAVKSANEQNAFGTELFRTIGDVDPRMAFELVADGTFSTARLPRIVQAMDAARANYADPTPKLHFQGSVTQPDGAVTDLLILGPISLSRDSFDGVTSLMKTSESGVHGMLEQITDDFKRANQSWDFTPMRRYLMPDDVYVQNIWDGKYYNQTKDQVEALNRIMTSDPPTVTVSTIYGDREIPIYGLDLLPEIKREDVIAAMEQMARETPYAIKDIPEVQVVHGIGHELTSDGRWVKNVMGQYDPRTAIITIDTFYGDGDTVIHEAYHSVWRNNDLDNYKPNPFVDDHGSGHFSEYGKTKPEENFCEAAIVMMRDIEEIKTNWTEYLRRHPSVPAEKLRWLVQLSYNFDPAAPLVPPTINPNGPS